ncbi:MAG: signal peptidase I [Eubacterium sp.]|nr:signal peptidase I [Eubacterium sp.]
MKKQTNTEELSSSLTDEQKKKVAAKKANKRLVIDTVRMVTVLAIATAIFFIFFGLKVVDGNGMYPALMDGDLALTYSKSEYVKNDVVFYKADGKEYCGRVVAKTGDSISFSDDGKFYVNGMVQSSKIVFPTDTPENAEKNMIVPDNSVYILGDYRTSCVDSRDLGFISLDDVDSKIIAILRHKKI